jgi:hypothetical protein
MDAGAWSYRPLVRHGKAPCPWHPERFEPSGRAIGCADANAATTATKTSAVVQMMESSGRNAGPARIRA